MTELTQSPVAPSVETETVTVVAQPVPDAHTVTFTELVYAHFAWWHNRHGLRDHSRAGQVYDTARATFEERHGEIVNSYWCSNVESAVALTQKRRGGGVFGQLWSFHRETDWATQDYPEVASELHRCDELAVRATAVLTGVRQRICLQLVVASAAHLLSLVDARARDSDDSATAAALAKERTAIDKAEAYYREAANGQAQMVYFGGMALVTIVLSLIATVWLTLSWATPVAALIAGAIGAVISVVQRITSGKFTLETDVGGYPFFLGGLRPLIGGVFAMAISFAFSGGLLHTPVAANETVDHRRLALLVIGFIAGFSERWAQDTLTSVVPAAKPPDPHQPKH
jgi:hypothetical protein